MASKCIFPNLSAELARKQLTQSRLGEKMNLDDSTMSLKMTGKREITLGEAKKMKSILSVEVPVPEVSGNKNKSRKCRKRNQAT